MLHTPNAVPIAGPYSHSNKSVSRTMMWVMLALTPATLVSLYLFGWPAIYLFLSTLAAAATAEALCLYWARKPLKMFLGDGSAVLTGWLLAMTLPPWAPWWIGVVGAFLAIIVGKQVFGGIGQNLFNPAMIARVALLISFPLQMTSFTIPAPLTDVTAPDARQSISITFGGESDYLATGQLDALTSATALGHLKTELARGVALPQARVGVDSLWQLSWGHTAGSLGETSALLLFLGGLLLIFTRVISWHIPLAMLATLGGLATIFHGLNPSTYVSPLTHLLSGAAVLGAFFIATDLVTSPVTGRGQLIFGAGCGGLVFAIRTWAGYPEGVAFAVLLMNACTPLIDHYVKPRIYGRDRTGQPLDYSSQASAGSRDSAQEKKA